MQRVFSFKDIAQKFKIKLSNGEIAIFEVYPGQDV